MTGVERQARWAWVVALCALAVAACARSGRAPAPPRQSPPLVSVDVQGGPDFSRITLVWMGEVYTRHELRGEGAGRQVVLEISPARLPDSLDPPFARVERGRAFERPVVGGPVESIRLEPGAEKDGVRVILRGEAIHRYRATPFTRPYRLVVDVFTDAEPDAASGDDALGSLVEAMSGVSEATTPPPQRGPLLVVLDAGHGGFEPGATGARGVREKDVNLAIARAVHSRLAAIPEVSSVLTRDADVFLPLKERTDFANELDADLFISIHANAAPSRSLSGIETYYLNTATDAAAARLARRENEVAGGLDRELGDDHLLGLLRDLSVDGQVEHSRGLALNVQHQLISGLRGIYGPDSVRDLGVKTALFYVLVGTRMPSILVETAFVSNPMEEIRLSDAFYQDEVAAAVVRGILGYAQEAGRLPGGHAEPLP